MLRAAATAATAAAALRAAAQSPAGTMGLCNSVVSAMKGRTTATDGAAAARALATLVRSPGTPALRQCRPPMYLLLQSRHQQHQLQRATVATLTSSRSFVSGCMAVRRGASWSAAVGLLVSQCYARNNELVAFCYEAAAEAMDAPVAEEEGQPGRVRRALDAVNARFRRMRLRVAETVNVFFEPSSLLLIGGHHGYDKRGASLFRLAYHVLRMASRAAYISIIFFPVLVFSPAAILLGDRCRKYWYALLVTTLALGGPAFIKWGQWASARLDMFPKALCDELATLQSNAPEHSAAITRRIVKEAFGSNPEDLFEQFEYKPMASGSIAQVHRAVLGDKGAEATGMPVGTQLAIKVRHPGVEEVLETDFALMTLFARGLSMLPGFDHYVGLEESIKQFGVPLKQQVDLSLEARSLSMFSHNFRHLSETVLFPEPLYPYVHPAVLVETFQEGVGVMDFINRRDPCNGKLAEIGIRSLLKMMLVDNFIHADLHPGNLLVHMKTSTSPQLVILDVGMTTELKKDDSMNVISFFRAITRRDGDNLAKCVLLLSTNGCENPTSFREELSEKFHMYQDNENNENLSECITDLLNIVRKHRVSFNGDVFNVIMTTVVLEGWASKLDPNINLMNMIKKAFAELKKMDAFKETIQSWRPWFF